jgi:hypothetical protein
MADPFLTAISILAAGFGTAYHTLNSRFSEAPFYLREPSFAAAKRQIPPTGKTGNRRLLLFSALHVLGA